MSVPKMKPLVVVMGVSGSGKTTVGMQLAEQLSVPFIDADDLHPEANIAKMASEQPLTDEDRWPWLRLVGAALHDADADGHGLIVACSALKRDYRDEIRSEEDRTRFLLLDGPRDLLLSRLSHRTGHFMPASLLDSQLATLERLDADEAGATVSVDADVPTIVAQARRELGW